MINTEWQLLLIPDKSPRDPFFSVQSSRCIVFLVLNFQKKKRTTQKIFLFFFFMKWILYCVRRKGKVHKLYTHCFANTIIRVCTDHCFVGLNNCLLVIAGFSCFLFFFSFFSSSSFSPLSSSSSSSFSYRYQQAISLGIGLNTWLNCHRLLGFLSTLPYRGRLSVLKKKCDLINHNFLVH